MTAQSLLPTFEASSASHGALLVVVEVFWWMNAATSTAIAIAAPYLQVRHHSIPSLKELGPFLFLSIAATVISAATGSTVAAVLPPARAWNVVLASYIVLGTGLPICLGFMSLHFLRLVVHGLPARGAIISMFLPLGPCGQAGLALVQLSQVVRSITGEQSDGSTRLGTEWTSNALVGASIWLTFMLWGLGLAWILIATSSVIYTWRTTGLQFNVSGRVAQSPHGAHAHSLSRRCSLAIGAALSQLELSPRPHWHWDRQQPSTPRHFAFWGQAWPSLSCYCRR